MSILGQIQSAAWAFRRQPFARPGFAVLVGAPVVLGDQDSAEANFARVFWLLPALNGAAAISEADDTIASTGALAIAGSEATTEADDTLSATGALAIAGASAGVEEDDALVATGELAAAASSSQSGVSRLARSYPAEYAYPTSYQTAPLSFARINEMLGFVQQAMGKLETPPAPAADKAPAFDAKAAAELAAKRVELEGMVAKLKEMAEAARQREETITLAAIEAVEAAQQDDDETALLLLVA